MLSEPKFLYHYTTVEKLALILKKQRIMFSPLTALDDKQEEEAEDTENFAKYVFISSWTRANKESIPMWKIYSDLYCGVRIKLPVCPFKEYIYDTEEYIKCNPMVLPIDTPKVKLIIPIEEVSKPYYIVPQFNKKSLLWNVSYTKKSEELKPAVKQLITDRIAINLTQLGHHKNQYWDFQNEWRYILFFNPVSINEIKSNNVLQTALNRFRDNNYTLPFRNYFLMIDDSSFLKMQITLSPKITEGNRTIVELLKNEYNKNMKIRESKLINTIR